MRAGRSTPDQARGTIEQFTQVSAHVSGIVVVGSESRRRYGYGYYKADPSRRRGSGRTGAEAEESPGRASRAAFTAQARADDAAGDDDGLPTSEPESTAPEPDAEAERSGDDDTRQDPTSEDDTSEPVADEPDEVDGDEEPRGVDGDEARVGGGRPDRDERD